MKLMQCRFGGKKRLWRRTGTQEDGKEMEQKITKLRKDINHKYRRQK